MSIQDNTSALEALLEQAEGLNDGSGESSGTSTTAAPFVVTLEFEDVEGGTGNVSGMVNEEAGTVYDTLSDEDKEYLFNRGESVFGIGCAPYFTVRRTGEGVQFFFECDDNYDSLLEALRAGRTAYISASSQVNDFGYPVPPNVAVTGFMLGRLGLVVMTNYHWVWFPNGSYHNADTDPWTDTWG